MKTEDLITMLATGAGAVQPPLVGLRFSGVMALGFTGSLLLMISTLKFLPDLLTALTLQNVWIKLVFTGSIAVISLIAAVRVSLPGRKAGSILKLLLIPIVGIWGIGFFELVSATPDQRVGLIFGQTWAVCSVLIAMLSIPVFVALLGTMRNLAPTKLRLAGAIAGMCSGATGAFVYCLHCPELDIPFIGTWYLLGMLIPTAAGAIIGRSVLRW
jgi:hypothetical protein